MKVKQECYGIKNGYGEKEENGFYKKDVLEVQDLWVNRSRMVSYGWYGKRVRIISSPIKRIFYKNSKCDKRQK